MPAWDALEVLIRGNCRFQVGRPEHTRKSEYEKQTARNPIAIVVGCGDPGADNRRALDVPVGNGGIFQLKNAGARYISDYADDIVLLIQKKGVRLVLVLTHTDCAAIGITCQHFYHREPTRALGVVRDVIPAFEKTAREGDTGTPAHVQRATRRSAMWNAKLIRDDARIMGISGPRGSAEEIVVVAGTYNLLGKTIEFFGEEARNRQQRIYAEMNIPWPFAKESPGAAAPTLASAAGK